MNFSKVLTLLNEEFDFRFALIGGLAISFYTTPRTTQDLDFAILSEDFDKAKKILLKNSYELVFKTNDIATFISKDKEFGRIDFILAHRKHLISMIEKADIVELIPKIKIKILKPEHLIALKIQAYNNDSGRTFQDLADIENLLKTIKNKDYSEIESYFKMFNKENDFRKIKERLKLK